MTQGGSSPEASPADERPPSPPLSRVTVTGDDAWVFHWTWKSVDDPVAYVADRTKTALVLRKKNGQSTETQMSVLEANKLWRENPGYNAGYGLYVAADPLHAAADFGNTLVAFRMKKGQKLVVAGNQTADVSRAAVLSSECGILYRWFGGISFTSQNAAAFRSPECVDLSDVRAYKTKTVLFNDLAPYSAGRGAAGSTPALAWEGAVSHFTGQMGFLSEKSSYAGLEKSLRSWKGKGRMVTEDGKLTDLGVIRAINSEFHHGAPKLMAAFDGLLAENALPRCKANIDYAVQKEGAAFMTATKGVCKSTIISLLMDAYLHPEDSLSDEEKFSEAVKVLVRSGYLAEGSWNKEKPSEVLANVVSRWRAQANAVARAEEALALLPDLAESLKSPVFPGIETR